MSSQPPRRAARATARQCASRRALLCRDRQGLSLGSCELADEAELVPERVLHHRPVDQRSSAFVRVRHGVHRGWVLQPAADRFDLRDRDIDVFDIDVDVRAVRRRIEPPCRVDRVRVGPLRRRDAVEDDLVLPGLLVLVAEVSEAVGPGVTRSVESRSPRTRTLSRPRGLRRRSRNSAASRLPRRAGF